MIVCSCNVVSDAMIKAALEPAHGKPCPRTPSAVYKCLGCSPCCGRCFVTVRGIIDETLGSHARHEARAPCCGGACEEHRVLPFERAPALAASA